MIINIFILINPSTNVSRRRSNDPNGLKYEKNENKFNVISHHLV